MYDWMGKRYEKLVEPQNKLLYLELHISPVYLIIEPISRKADWENTRELGGQTAGLVEVKKESEKQLCGLPMTGKIMK